MAIRVALNHKTTYDYDRLVTLFPQIVRLRPAPHCRTPVASYSLKISPQDYFLNWQQDPHGNYLARLVFPEKVDHFHVEVDVVAEMTVINPFDFFLEPAAGECPFAYEPWLSKELQPFLETLPVGPNLSAYLETIDRSPLRTIDFLVGLNQRLQKDIKYLIRLEPGVQTPEETLTLRCGSCRDTSWLMVQILRHLGLAARFVSGYLIQLVPDIKSLDGPSGAAHDFTDLHAWAELYLPGAGWIGLDPTSGLMAGEGHLPLAATPDPSSASPITGSVDSCETEFTFAMSVTRIHEDPRVTKPYTDGEWREIEALGHQIDERLTAGDVRLTMGGEPTFVSVDDMEGPEWNTTATSPKKRQLADKLIHRLKDRFAPGALLHFGEGKWYPGESLPRWAFACYWRTDGQPIWDNPKHFAEEGRDYGHEAEEAEEFVTALAQRLEVGAEWVLPAYEDPVHYVWKERRLPVDVNPSDSKLKDAEERERVARVFERGLGSVVGYVLPLKRQWWQAQPRWFSGRWPIRSEQVFLLPGDSPMGLRLPLDSLPHESIAGSELYEVDPLAQRPPLPDHQRQISPAVMPRARRGKREQEVQQQKTDSGSVPVVRTALCVQPRDGCLHVFMPPAERVEDYLDLVAVVEDTAESLQMPVVIEGYTPPHDHRVNYIKVTPDPGVIEVNIHPALSWDEMVRNTTWLYEDARQTRLGTEKFNLDGRHTGTGGGNHVVLGGPTPADSPFLRRPDLLRSLIGYWNNHPSLSYLFSGGFIGPTSQAPRVDEGRRNAIYELQIAFQQISEPNGVPGAESAKPQQSARDSGDAGWGFADSAPGTQSQPCPPWQVDRAFRHLLVDLTGNTHRAEFCIDKLYSPDTSTGRLGLVEFRAFEMPPHAQMSLTQQLLVRALVARFWEQPYKVKLVDWGTTLHDRFMLPHFIRQDFDDVIAELRQAGFSLDARWFAPHFEFRFPFIGEIVQRDIKVELRQAIEPWYVLGEEPAGGATARYVDSSVERLQVKVTGMTDSRHIITCNGRKVPLRPTGTQGEFVAGVRYRAWQPPSCLHPTIPVHTPLVFDVLDTWMRRSIGGCTYHMAHPGGLSHETFPVNSYEAESRRTARFFKMGHTPSTMKVPADEPNPDFPLTLDLRR